MKRPRPVLTGSVAILVGFLGGIWFVGQGSGLEWINAWQGRSVPPLVVAGAAPVPNLKLVTPTGVVGLPPEQNWTYGSTGLAPLIFRPDLMPSPTCDWEVEPRPLQLDQEWHQTSAERELVGVPLLDSRSGRLQCVLLQSFHYHLMHIPLRVVVFDATGRRFVGQPLSEPPTLGAAGSLRASRLEWTKELTIVPPGSLSFGVERVPDDPTEQAEADAQAQAQARGLAILPPPRLGEPFPFDLPTVAGGRVRSSDLRGKVVLVVIDGAASPTGWSLNESLRQFSPEDLAVVAISLNQNPGDAAGAWDLTPDQQAVVFVPNDREIRRFWTAGAAITHRPSFRLLDRSGVLRSTLNRRDLPDRIQRLIQF